MRLSHAFIFVSSFLIAFDSSSGLAQDKTASGPEWDKAQKAVVATVDQYVIAFNKGDSKALEAFFAEDARLTTVDGEVFQGRDAILELYREGFEGNAGLTMRTEIRSVRLIGDTAAIEAGFLYTKTTADPKEDVVAYEVVHVKRDGTWRMFDIYETTPVVDGPIEPHAEKLAPLDFLVGEWLEESETAEIVHTVRWTPNRRYLLLNFHSEDLQGKPVRVAEQRVGWDPRSKSIRSWLFEEDGGHANGLWTPSEDGLSWTVKMDGVLADGRLITSTMRFERVTAERIRILGYDRTLDGKAIDDAGQRHLVRKPKSGNAKSAK